MRVRMFSLTRPTKLSERMSAWRNVCHGLHPVALALSDEERNLMAPSRKRPASPRTRALAVSAKTKKPKVKRIKAPERPTPFEYEGEQMLIPTQKKLQNLNASFYTGPVRSRHRHTEEAVTTERSEGWLSRAFAAVANALGISTQDLKDILKRIAIILAHAVLDTARQRQLAKLEATLKKYDQTT